MMRSGDRAAHAALVRETARLALTPVDRLLERSERRRIAAAEGPMQPIVLIVGGSRAGTTLVYQTLARHLPVTYFTNLSSLFPRSPLTASKLFQSGPPNARIRFQSYYGNTVDLAGPNDGFHIWNKWLGADRYRAAQTLSERAVGEMRQSLTAWTQTFGRPLLNKNNRNADCVALLGRVLPEAVFVVVRRDPVRVAQSLVVAREEIQGSKRWKWGVRSEDQEPGSDRLGYVDAVCRQIMEVERKLAEDTRMLASNRLIDIQYEAFCENPGAAIVEISRRVWGAPSSTLPVVPEVQPHRQSDNRHRVNPEELERIRGCLTGFERIRAG
jgi:hypothetical protein